MISKAPKKFVDELFQFAASLRRRARATPAGASTVFCRVATRGNTTCGGWYPLALRPKQASGRRIPFWEQPKPPLPGWSLSNACVALSRIFLCRRRARRSRYCNLLLAESPWTGGEFAPEHGRKKGARGPLDSSRAPTLALRGVALRSVAARPPVDARRCPNLGTGLGPRFRLPSVDRRHPSSLGMGVPSSAPSCLPQRHYRSL